MHASLSLLRFLHNQLPPLFPEEQALELRLELNRCQSNPSITPEEAEDMLIRFGAELWPWRQAFREFVLKAEADVGEHFLLPKLSPALQECYLEFVLYGGSLRNVREGTAADFFSVEERIELCSALVKTERELWQYATQQIVGLERENYLSRVASYTRRLASLNEKLVELAAAAGRETDHPELAAQMRARVRLIEEGLCLLGPEQNYEFVRTSVSFFQGRREELHRLKDIVEPLQVDWSAIS